MIEVAANIDALEALLANGQDNALLRFSLGNAYLQCAQAETAADHLRKAVQFDAQYSAAWKLLAKALMESGQTTQAQSAFEQGIAVAEQKGDIQAAKEMRVFLRRLEKSNG